MDLAVEILKELAGEEHPRTATAMRNLTKASEDTLKRERSIMHGLSGVSMTSYKHKKYKILYSHHY